MQPGGALLLLLKQDTICISNKYDGITFIPLFQPVNIIFQSLRASSRLFLSVLQAWKHQVFQFQAANPAYQDEELHPPDWDVM